MAWSEISVFESACLLAAENPPRLVDVREPDEYAICHVEGSTLVPLSSFRGDGSDDIGSKSGVILVLCHQGVRSLHAVRYLDQIGYEDVRSIAGGIDQWSVEIDPSMKRY